MRIFLLTLLLITPCFAQKSAPQPCTLTLKDAPSLRGLKLGMSESTFHARFARTPLMIVDERAVKENPEFQGVDHVRFDFYKERLAIVAVDYDRSIKWTSIAEFTETLSKKLALPADAWTFIENIEGVMECSEFRVNASLISNQVELTDLRAEREINSYRNAPPRDKKKDFKPQR